MKTFKTTGTKSPSAWEEAQPITFKIDDDEFTAYPPTEGQIAYMMASQAQDREMADTIAGILDFFTGLLDAADAAKFRRRFLDRDDNLSFETMQDVIESLVEEWSERPTKPSSDSTTSRARTGRKSTAKQHSED